MPLCIDRSLRMTRMAERLANHPTTSAPLTVHAGPVIQPTLLTAVGYHDHVHPRHRPSPLRHPNPHSLVEEQTHPLLALLPALPAVLLRRRGWHRGHLPHALGQHQLDGAVAAHLRVLHHAALPAPLVLSRVHVVDLLTHDGDAVGEHGFAAPRLGRTLGLVTGVHANGENGEDAERQDRGEDAHGEDGDVGGARDDHLVEGQLMTCGCVYRGVC